MKSIYLFSSSRSSGFTLIELLVTITIMLIVIGGSIAGFIAFSDRREVQETARQVQQMFVLAQQKASVQEVPLDCRTNNFPLQAYRVQITDTSPQVAELLAICLYFQADEDDSGPYPFVHNGGVYSSIQSFEIPSSVTITPNESFVEFYTLERGALTETGATSRTYTFSGASTSYQFTVSNGGRVSNVQ